MPALLRLFFDICLLRANPQDLPASTVLMMLALGVHVVINVLGLINRAPLFSAIQVAFIDTLVLVAIVHTALMLRNLAVRSRQTLTALAGCGALLSLIAWPGFQLTHGTNMFLLVVLLFLVWQLAVFGHILRHALSLPFVAGVALSIVYIVVSVSAVSAIDLGLGTEIQK